MLCLDRGVNYFFPQFSFHARINLDLLHPVLYLHVTVYSFQIDFFTLSKVKNVSQKAAFFKILPFFYSRSTLKFRA